MEIKLKNNKIKIRRSLKRDIVLPIFWLIVLVLWLTTVVLSGLKFYNLISLPWIWVFAPLWGVCLLLTIGFLSLIVFLVMVKYTL